MDDRVGTSYYFEIIILMILILLTAFFYDCSIQHQRHCGLESENQLIQTVTILLNCLIYALQMHLSLYSVSPSCADFKLHDNLEILVILPLWQMFNVCEGEKVPSKNVVGVQRWIVLWMKDLLG